MNPLHSGGKPSGLGLAALGLIVLGLLGGGLYWLASEFGYQSNDANLPFAFIFASALLGLSALISRLFGQRFWRRLTVCLIRSWRRRR